MKIHNNKYKTLTTEQRIFLLKQTIKGLEKNKKENKKIILIYKNQLKELKQQWNLILI